eukprot:TRINITY_DN4515_c0_g1_i5.p1 TRINITY_DN4515_c0_g1~~TRINITY_DN4515_c0_g1_i5.p1  ORF type:complete len:1061 (-),score=178.45 TRINITY_DN4515_c0_g1_i5:334-3474(-)
MTNPKTSVAELPSDEVVQNMDTNVLSWFKKRNGDTLKGALAFVPWVLQQSHAERADSLNEKQIVVHQGEGAVVFSDASGFTALTERLAKRSDGAELLSKCLTDFFTPLIDLINAYRGDVIKFSGDALTVYFPAFDDTKSPKYNNVVPPHGTWGLPDLGPMATAVLRACACCIEIHKRLHMFDTGIDGVFLCLHIGVGCGDVHILQVGGAVPPETHVPRLEYFIAGPPLEQIAEAEPLAKNGETCLSPQAWKHVKSCVMEGETPELRPEFHLLTRMDEQQYTFPTVKHAAQENDNRAAQQFSSFHLPIIRRYIPSAVYKQIECGTLTYVNEMRNISVIFISGIGLNVMSETGPAQVQELVASVQKACYQHEGTLNKFLIDDKGMLFLLVFGLPPLVHTDDPTRAVLACLDMVKVFKRLRLVGRFGVTTGKSYCGVCGSARRMEYTVLGDCVNLSARLMSRAPKMGILCDDKTKLRCSTEIIFNAMAPIKVKGKSAFIPIFQPAAKEADAVVGLTSEMKISFPWHESPFGDMSSLTAGEYQEAVIRLCSIKSWQGIRRACEMLGGDFKNEIHNDQAVPIPERGSLPPNGPFAKGGVVVLEGPTGIGKTEVAEHMVTHALVTFRAFPVFGSMGPRPGDAVKLGAQLLESTIGIFRATRVLPANQFEAVKTLAGAKFSDKLPSLKQIIEQGGSKDQLSNEKSKELLEISLEVVVHLLTEFSQTSSVIMSLQFEYGTSLFPKKFEDQTIFWNAVTTLYSDFIKPQPASSKPRVMILVCRDSQPPRAPWNAAVEHAKGMKTLLSLEGLDEDAISQYVSSYLNLPPDSLVPPPLRHFVSQVTLGNPLYIRETIDELSVHHIQLNQGAGGQIRSVEVKDIDKVNVSEWGHTQMVGNTVCRLEALDPLESAVLKMSTCFVGAFTLGDLSASTCPRWADSTNLDFLLLFQAIRNLLQVDMIESVDPPTDDLRSSPIEEVTDPNARKLQYFQTRNLLIRQVGGAMVLEVQKKSVKRQALIDRALLRELPIKMAKLATKRKQQHIPWYYEVHLRGSLN